jgi:pyridoxamine 5'-phosphate oxidase
LGPDPLREFEKWFEAARASGEAMPEAMALATASPAGVPSVRMVLFKGIHEGGFEFFTNFHSRKGREMEANPRAAVVFWWERLRRQVRVEGRVEKMGAEQADEYFRTRQRGSQLGAWASRQSSVISDRADLEQTVQALQARYRGREVPRPPFWGGFRLLPDIMEFWHGRENRLHDRFRYRRSEDRGWLVERLAP